jgi:hypothetical protein
MLLSAFSSLCSYRVEPAAVILLLVDEAALRDTAALESAHWAWLRKTGILRCSTTNTTI